MAQIMMTKPIIKALSKTPYNSTDGVPRDNKKVIARYFLPGSACTWYVLEDDDCFQDKENLILKPNHKIVYGAATLGYGLELGSIDLDEVFAAKVLFCHTERDISVVPLKETLGELRKRYCEEWG